MSTMNSIRLAFNRDRDNAHDDEQDPGPPIWVVAITVVTAVVIVVGLAVAGVLPTFIADDAGSMLFGGG